MCVCEPAAASTHDDADDTRNERHQLLTDDTATAHSDVAETIPLARLDQPDVDQQTEAIPSPAGTLPSGRECKDNEDEDGSCSRLQINIQSLM